MMDLESKSLWSHLLGKAVEGQHKGTLLKVIPSDITTWGGWKGEHPKTTVLNLSRSSRQFVKDFYKAPSRFVVGFKGRYGMHHVSMTQLLKQPVANVDARGKPLLIVFDPNGTSTRVFGRRVDERLLTFNAHDNKTLQDAETGSIWNRRGEAVSGPLLGRKLLQHVSIPSFKRAWETFHPDSHLIDILSKTGR